MILLLAYEVTSRSYQCDQRSCPQQKLNSRYVRRHHFSRNYENDYLDRGAGAMKQQQ
jgi:hypothetical protein